MWLCETPEKAGRSLSYNELPYHPSRLFWDSECQQTWWWPHFLGFACSKVLLTLHSFVKLDRGFGNGEMRTPKCYGNSRDSGFPFFWIPSSEVFLYLLGFWDSSLRRKRGVEWDWGLYNGRFMDRSPSIGYELQNYHGNAVSFFWWLGATKVSISGFSML